MSQMLTQSQTACFFYTYDHHQDLHSFPTRRSSDLLTRRPNALAAGRWRDGDEGPARRRSEEHTSELQSLRHLVCRLLLEKKNNKRRSVRLALRQLCNTPIFPSNHRFPRLFPTWILN